MSFREDVKKMLRESGWTQHRLSQESGIKETYLSRYLNHEDDKSVFGRLYDFVHGPKRPKKKGAHNVECAEDAWVQP